MKLQGFYFITDSKLCEKDTLESVTEAVEGGAQIVQYREKDLTTRQMVLEAAELKQACAGKALFLINDRVDIALAADADGVHVGQDDMPLHTAKRLLGEGKIVGVTVHDVEEAMKAEAGGADYLGVSPIYHTETKKDAGEPAGIQLIKDVREATTLPIVAIGGINEDNVDPVVEAGADMICAISATVCKKNICSAVELFAQKIVKE